MDATSVWLGQYLTQRIQEQREARLATLVNGAAADFADYKARAAYLAALNDVEKWMTEARLDADDDRRRRSA